MILNSLLFATERKNILHKTNSSRENILVIYAPASCEGNTIEQASALTETNAKRIIARIP